MVPSPFTPPAPERIEAATGVNVGFPASILRITFHSPLSACLDITEASLCALECPSRGATREVAGVA